MVRRMLQVVGDPKRIDRAIKRLHGALKGVPARGVRLTWRGGELRTTIHWARDDAFWWAVEPRPDQRHDARHALLLGHAPDRAGASARASPASSTCRAPGSTGRWPASSPPTSEARSTSPIPAAWAAPTGQRKAGFREFLADGVWRTVQWPDGEETEALIVAPLDSPRLTRLLGRFVDSVHRFKDGETPASQHGACASSRRLRRFGRLPPATARLVDAGAARGACQARPVRRHGRSLLAARRASAAAVRAGRRRPAGRAGAGRRLAVARRARAAAPTFDRS